MLGVSIVTYHTDLKELRNVIASLRSPLIERIDIVDNGREQRIKDFCQSQCINYIPSENNGYGAGHNISILRSISNKTKYHLVINSDISFDAEIIDKMIRYMEQNESIGAMHPRILGADGEDQFTVRMLPTPFDLMLRRFMPKSLFAKRRDIYLLKHLDHNKMFSVPYMQGSFMLMRTKAVGEAGLFDERFFMYPEDIDLTRRIHRIWQVLYYPDAIVTHLHRAESYGNWRMTMVHIRNMIRYFNKWGWFVDKERKEINKQLALRNE